ncbi:hypothetical protein [Kribbella catacumbae]|uniref:hypothetical protein n=1 Tax=Kribbella catacumbae TaxID=460086 RepID=UPI0012F771CC|nr:hypothetical protein [Kribbella catacumbae]
MASLASFTTLYVTAIRVVEPGDLADITAIRWDGGDLAPEESSVADFIGWLDRGDARAFVRQPDGARGPRIVVSDSGGQRYLRSLRATADQPDALLLLPRWQPSKKRKHMAAR